MVLVHDVDAMSIQEVAMRFGEIIEKAWKLTWRYRYLWVLALFAGITGPAGGGGGGNFNSGSSFPSGSDASSGNPFDAGFFSEIGRWLPIIVLVVSLWIILSLAWAVLGVAARGGLIWAVDEIESGRVPRLGQAWSVGFSRFWRMFGLSLLLGLPVMVLLLLLLAGIFGPLAFAAMKGGDAFAGAIAPVCGTLVIGVPLLIVFGVVLGIMQVIAHRSIMLEGAHVMEAARGAWRLFRSRVKDTLLMWLVSWGLSIGASIVLAIPIVLLTIALLLPAMVAGFAGNWGPLIGAGVVWLLIVLVVSFAYTAFWGTFTSALWTIFYRRLVGREALPPTVMPNLGPQPPAYGPPGQAMPQPYYAPEGMPVPPAPPMAPYGQGPPMAAPQQAQPPADWAPPAPPAPPEQQDPPQG
jgi:hypothetical protein